MDIQKVLCLHGCCQTPEAFSSYLNSLRKIGKKKEYSIEFYFLKAPFEHPDGGFTWTNPPLNIEDIWHDKNSVHTRENALNAVLKLKKDLSILEKSFQILEEEIEKIQPSVLLGFSQGSFVIYEYLRNRWNKKSSVKKVVAMSGYTFDNISENEMYDLPILNVIHPMDIVVPPTLKFEKSKSLYLLEHNNKDLEVPCREAHRVATRNGHMRIICNFISTGSI